MNEILRIDKTKTALVVIDLQKGIVGVAARSKEEHVHTLKVIFPRIGLVRKAADVLAGLF